MQTLRALDRRRHPRRDASLLVRYCRTDTAGSYDITQTRNVSQGGMLLTTARALAPGARLTMTARLCLQGLPRLVKVRAEAVASRELVRGFVYETRVRFLDQDSGSFRIFEDFCAAKDEPA